MVFFACNENNLVARQLVYRLFEVACQGRGSGCRSNARSTQSLLVNISAQQLRCVTVHSLPPPTITIDFLLEVDITSGAVREVGRGGGKSLVLRGGELESSCVELQCRPWRLRIVER